MSNKWLVGVLTTLCTGLLLWWLTHEGGPLNPPKPPHLAIVAWDYSSQPDKDDFSITSYSGQLTVYNDGESTAESCYVYDNNGKLIGGPPFGVPPKQNRSVPVWISIPTPKHGSGADLKMTQLITAKAQVKCDKDVSSDIFERSMGLNEP